MGFSPSNKHGTTTSIFSNIVDAETGSFVSSLTVSGVPVDIAGLGAGALNNIVEDTSPQLGGALDCLDNTVFNAEFVQGDRLIAGNDGAHGASLPHFTWNVDTDSGMYRDGIDAIGFSAGGNSIVSINTTGMTMDVGTLTVSGVPVDITGGGGGGTTEGPAFSADTFGDDLTIPTGADTLLAFDREQLDTDGDYDITTFRFTPSKAGTYFLQCTVRYNTSLPAATLNRVFIKKNGATVRRGPLTSHGAAGGGATVTTIEQANGTTDFFEAFAQHCKGSDATIQGAFSETYFFGYFVRDL